MFIFRRDPNSPSNTKNLIITLALAAIAFYVIYFYLLPLLTTEPVHGIVQIVVVLLAIFFLIDLFL